jgi:hypothetical protein
VEARTGRSLKSQDKLEALASVLHSECRSISWRRVEVFLKVWKPGNWNCFRIRSVGALPYLTAWIDGEKISEPHTAKIKLTNFEPKAMLDRIGRSGNIVFEAHDNARIGNDRWAPGSVYRSNFYFRTL